jgi:ABC-type nitrate/sulfonate/bicarbonate transport system substrate-binding protein
MKRILSALLILVVLFSAGCTKKDPEKITVKLKWLHQAQFAGNYVAKEKGFYEEEGLDVTLLPFSFDDPTIDAVANGEATFGITGADELIFARSKGIPIKAFAVIYQVNPVCAYSIKESGILKPQDFIGRTVGLEQGTNVDTLYYVMMSRLGIDRSNINEIPIGYDATELLAGETDISTGYIINEPHQVIESGKEVNTILMADYGANMYADVLFATEETINNNPEQVQKFLNATIKGWRYAIENTDEAVDITLLYATNRTKSHETYMLEKSMPLINTGDVSIGWMTKEGWGNVQNILLEQNILNKKIDMEHAYTLNFLNNEKLK